VTRLRYATVLFDLDHTLFDTDTSEDLAFDQTLRTVGIEEPGAYRAAYDRINTALWQAVERGERTPDEVRTERFRRLVAEADLAAVTGIAAAPLAVELADAFVAGLGAHGELYEGAAELLAALAAIDGLALGLVTNGLGEVQRARLARLGLDDCFASVVVSGEVGVSKPDPRIFELAFAGFATDTVARGDRALMVGDNLRADIAGGRAAGIHTCWYHPHGRGDVAPVPQPEHEIDALPRLLPLVTE
jgi:YjjG family noncanonical pyrimidine nucleotidase